MGETGLSHDIFFKFSLWPFELYDKWFQSSDLFDFAIFPFALLTRVQPQNSTLIVIRPQQPRKAKVRI